MLKATRPQPKKEKAAQHADPLAAQSELTEAAGGARQTARQNRIPLREQDTQSKSGELHSPPLFLFSLNSRCSLPLKRVEGFTF